jgi:hypothetical protein
MNVEKLILLVGVLLLSGCSKLVEIPDDKFIGVWQLNGREMFDGIQIKIERRGKKLTGKIFKLNGNKLVNMFSAIDDTWISEITRTSNTEFRLTEKKIARDLFSLYGLPTAHEFKAEFIDDNTIGLGGLNSDVQHSVIIYKRIE